MIRVATVLILSSVLLIAGTAESQSPAGTGAGSTRLSPTLSAARLDGEIRIDGRLDEPAWERAELATDFTQSYPDPGAAPSQRTEARILYDEQYLYVGLRMYDTEPDSIAGPLARRDPTQLYSDWVHLMIDSRFDRRTAFRFSVNPRGVQRDVFHFDDGNEDGSWDAVWQVATQMDSLGWTAEYRIPLSQLRFGGDADGPRTWGLQIMRDIARRGERASWAPWTRNDAGFVSRFGRLIGLQGVRAPRSLELIPYTTARLTRAPGDPADPFHRSNDPGASIGADLRLGLPRGLTLSATLNPDFGQVEADPAEVNLTAFETFFSERRPFFTEGADIFRFGESRAFNRYGFQEFFYSRRIGRAPQRRLGGPDVEYADVPQQTRILGAAKLSGRTPDGWTLGLMNAVTGRETARYLHVSGSEHETPVEPLSNYLVSRVRRDLRDGQSVLGGMLSATHRHLDDPALAPFLHRNAYVGGVDFLHTWADRTWSLNGFLAGSRVAGEPQVLLSTQRASARYFQRPDASYLRLDPERTSLVGYMGELALTRSGSWDASLQYKEASPGFEINDLGFQGRVDYRSLSTFAGRRVNRAWGPWRDHSYWAFTYHAWNFGGDPIIHGAAIAANTTFHNFWSSGFNFHYRPEYMDDRLTRGGPLASAPAQWTAFAFLESDPRRPVSVGGDFSYRGARSGLRERTLGVGADVRPSDALRLRFRPRLSRFENPAQHVLTGVDPAASATYGSRYVFADLQQTTLSLETRLDWTFSPQLSLQLYAQPFVSAGSYSNFKEFTTPRGFEFDRYGVDRGRICRFGSAYLVDPVGMGDCPATEPEAGDPNFTVRFGDPDFNFRSLRGNAVLRWEYRPGSTLFFVWQQQRSASEPFGDFDFRRDAGAIFREPAHNVFLIKASYWIGR